MPREVPAEKLAVINAERGASFSITTSIPAPCPAHVNSAAPLRTGRDTRFRLALKSWMHGVSAFVLGKLTKPMTADHEGSTPKAKSPESRSTDSPSSPRR